MQVFIDGQFYAKAEAKISVYDHGLLYGDGVFEGIRIYNGRIFKLEQHLARLQDSARVLMLRLPYSLEEFAHYTEETVRRSNITDGYIRLLVTRGVGDLGVDPAKCPRASVIIIVDQIRLYPAEYYQQGIKVITSSIRRMSADNIDPRVKSLNYLNNIMAKIEARQAGCLEAVMLNREGFVTECTGDNIFIVKQGVILTPASYLGILNGITRQTVFELAARLSLPCREASLTCYDLYTADECFLTGTGAGIIPVNTIDGRTIGESRAGEITTRLLAGFRELIAV